MQKLTLLVCAALLSTLAHATTLLNYQCADGTTLAITSAITPPISAPPPPVPPPVGASFSVFQAGVFHWGGDYSWGVTLNYRDTAGAPRPGPFDIAVTGIGGFQPYATNFDFDPSPYRFLNFSLKPTIAMQTWQSHFYAVGDIAEGALVNVLNFGPTPVIGQWAAYKIPLRLGGYELPASHIYKFMIQDQTADQGGFTTNKWYVDNIYFSAQ
ncbi:MAG: hypothetical protein JWO52_4059 [Gammaproteobacteria bacterium]|nr:hypothetical protein [Gammaproteobacteria bacterium]